MKLATFTVNDSPRPGLVQPDGVVDIVRHLSGEPLQMTDLIARWSEFGPRLQDLMGRPADYPLDLVRLHAPVPRPGKIMAIGLNYADHIAETGQETPKEQLWFTKAITSLSGPFDAIELPAVSSQLDYECELVVVIGTRCRNVPRERAREVIFGYCVGNDVSVRDWQFSTSQWNLGKSFDTHAPSGPWITTKDEVDPHGLDISCQVNGDTRQSSNTRNFVFDCYAQIEHLTKVMTLEPGDLLFTGTCGGIGAARKPPLWLRAGDVVRTEIAGLGAIENTVVPGSGNPRIG